jgi:hypothetical protein
LSHRTASGSRAFLIPTRARTRPRT